MSVTAVAKVVNKKELPDGQVALVLSADYNDPANKEWAKWTPGLTVNMTVKDSSVGDNFEHGKTYLLTFEEKVGE